MDRILSAIDRFNQGLLSTPALDVELQHWQRIALRAAERVRMATPEEMPPELGAQTERCCRFLASTLEDLRSAIREEAWPLVDPLLNGLLERIQALLWQVELAEESR
ncbi:MAG: hypothetical protein ACYCW6_22025 [Candidatus Xenobia bacterium]